MLGELPPVYIRGMARFFVSEAVGDDILTHIVAPEDRFYGGHVAISDCSTWITQARIAAFNAANPDAGELLSYPRAPAD